MPATSVRHILAYAILVTTGQVSAASLSQLAEPALDPAITSQLPMGGTIIAVEQREIAGQTYTFVKYYDEGNNPQTRIFDRQSAVVSERTIGGMTGAMVDSSLQRELASTPVTTKVRVNVALRSDTIDHIGPPVTASASGMRVGADTDRPGKYLSYEINGVRADELAIEQANAMKASQLVQVRAGQDAALRTRLQTLGQRHGLSKIPEFQDAVRDARATVTLTLTPAQILDLVGKSADLIAGIERYVPPQNQIASAMLSSRVNPWAINYAGRRGENIGIYMTEGGCPPAGFVTRYQRLSGNDGNHARNVAAIMRAVSPQSFIYCRGDYSLPTAADLNGQNGNPRVHIVNNSWGSTADDANYATRDRDWDNLVYDNAVTVFNAAGNTGAANGYVVSPGKGLNLITVGNYDDANDTIYYQSSFRDPQTKNAKPELSMPGTKVTAGGFNFTGTSQASPHGAGFAADLMAAYTILRLRPALMKADMISTATKPIVGGFDKVGVGAGDFYRAYYNGHYQYWEGNNSSYGSFDKNDPLPNNGYIDIYVNLSASISSVRATLAWLNRGTWTYDKRSAASSIGMDLDLEVYSPNGSSVARSTSVNNPYETVTFDPAVNGNYRFRIHRYANRDTTSKLHMGLAVDW